jgi:simple sugar transport system permease protein
MLGMALLTWLLLNKPISVGSSAPSAAAIRPSYRHPRLRYLSVCLRLFGRVGGDWRMLQAYRMSEVVPNALVGGELDVLAAAVLGGASSPEAEAR